MPIINPKHLFGATKHSLDGLQHAFKQEQAFRHEVIVLGLLIVTLIFSQQPFFHWLIVIGGWLLVMLTELLNSAIEEIFNLVHPDWHPKVKAGKDMASAAIFLALIINVGVWGWMIFG